MPNEALDDALQTIDVNPGLIPGNTDNASVLNRLEKKLEGNESSDDDATSTPMDTDETEESAPTSESEDLEGEEVDETEETEEESDTDESDDTDEESSEEEEYLELSPEDLAAAVGISADKVEISEDGQISFRTKVDGKEELVAADKLITSFQLEKHLRNKSTADAEKRREFEEQSQAERAKIQEAMTEAVALVNVLEQQFTQGIDQQELARLRAENPAEWSAKQQEIQQYQKFLDSAKGQLKQTIQKQQQEQQAKQAEAFNEYVNKQTQLLLEKVPEWTDQERAAKDMAELNRIAAQAYGFTDEEISRINDHRIFMLLRDAAKGRAITDTKPLKKKLKKVPKILKPTGKPRGGEDEAKVKIVRKKRKAVKESGGNIASVASLLEDRINVP